MELSEGSPPLTRGTPRKLLSVSFPSLGSPPLTRGTQQRRDGRGKQQGITPAYAGNTNKSEYGRRRSRDHPRLRGEHYSVQWENAPLGGSPPLTRGTPNSTTEYPKMYRITPAYAGNTTTYCLKITCCGDHPRLRGEHCLEKPQRGIFPGSPPHTRGTQ